MVRKAVEAEFSVPDSESPAAYCLQPAVLGTLRTTTTCQNLVFLRKFPPGHNISYGRPKDYISRKDAKSAKGKTIVTLSSLLGVLGVLARGSVLVAAEGSAGCSVGRNQFSVVSSRFSVRPPAFVLFRLPTANIEPHTHASGGKNPRTILDFCTTYRRRETSSYIQGFSCSCPNRIGRIWDRAGTGWGPQTRFIAFGNPACPCGLRLVLSFLSQQRDVAPGPYRDNPPPAPDMAGSGSVLLRVEISFSCEDL